MPSILDKLIQDKFNSKFGADEVLELFGEKTPTRDEMSLALSGLLAKQNNIKPGGFGPPLTFLGFDLLGEVPEFMKAKKLEARQAEHLKALAAKDTQMQLQEALAEFEKQQNADFVGSNVSQLPKEIVDILEPSGILPTKTETQSVPRLGPEQAAVSVPGIPPTDGFQEFGIDLQRDIPQTTPFGEQALAGPAGADLFSALTGATPGNLEIASRQADPGLQDAQVESQVLDPEGELSPQAIQQAALLRRTQLGAPRAESVPSEEAKAIIESVAISNGATDEQAKAFSSRIKSDIPLSTLNEMAQQIGQGARSSAKQAHTNSLKQQHFQHQEKMLELKKSVSSDLLKEGGQIKLENAMIIKQTMFEHQKKLEEGKLDGKMQLAEKTAKLNFENRLALQENELTDAQLNRDAAMARQVLRGEQALTLEDLRATNRLALQDLTDENRQGKEGMLEKFYLDFMKSNPSVAGQLLDILTDAPDGVIDLSTNSAIRSALNKRYKNIVESNLVETTLNTILHTDVFGDSFKDRMSSLHNEIRKFSDNGMDVTAMQKQLAYMETIAPGQHITVNNKPVGSPSEREDIAAYRDMLNSLEYIGFLYQPDFTGFFDNIEAKGKSVLGIIGSKEELFRSATDNLRAIITRARAGAAISAQEAVLLLASIPSLDVSDTKFIANFAETQRQIRNLLLEKYSLLGVTPEKRFKELQDMGKTPTEIHRRLVGEGLIPPPEKKGE